jgi:predicted alpha-1,2-mannosidase
MHRTSLWLASILLTINHLSAQRNYAALVNPFIGTGGHGHTFPGATLPFGIVQLSPDTRMDDWDGSSGYHYSDSMIYGFSHTHLSGTGVPDYCDLLFQPMVAPFAWQKEEYASPFSHQTEKASAGYYSVHLDKPNIDVELTATTRTGLQRYQYPDGTKLGNLIIDLTHRDPVIDAYIEIVDEYTIKGYRFSKSWASNQKLYFVAKFNRKIKEYALWQETTGASSNTQSARGRSIKAGFSFALKKESELMVKVGISAVSIEGAMRNLEAEQPDFDFKKTKEAARLAWNTELSKIEIEAYQAVQDTIFYTALYHTMLAPNVYQDIDGQYRGLDDQIHQAEPGHTQYSVFSLWDTHRALHPLMSIIDKKRTGHWVNTFLNHYKQSGLLPVWELGANETNCMIGYHAVPIILDAYNKDVRNFDQKLALDAMLKSAHQAEFGVSAYRLSGFLGNEVEAESVSRTLEYAFDDGCIADFANQIGRKDIGQIFEKHALNYRNLYNPKTQFFQGKLASNWYTPFDAREVNHFYTEGNAWHYAFTAQQDLGGLIELYGGSAKFANKLRLLFMDTTGLTGREQADVTGLIGQYAHGNEPSHHLAYLFNYTDQPAFGHHMIRDICTKFYLNTPDGLIGNEDCGQMSAWYIFSTLGFYPVHPANNTFAIGLTQFKKATLHLENGKDFVITAERTNPFDFRIRNCQVNGLETERLQLNYSDLRDGGTMHISYVSGKSPSLKNFKKMEANPLDRSQFTEVPFIVNGSNKFADSTRAYLQSVDNHADIFYFATPFDPDKSTVPDPSIIAFGKYLEPIPIHTHSTDIWCYTKKGSAQSALIRQTFYKIPNDKKIDVLSQVNPMYTDGGNISLIDGIKGNTNWRAGHWQSYYGNDFEAVIDLKSPRAISEVSAYFLQETKSWIWMPKSLEVMISSDGTHYKTVGSVLNTIPTTNELSQTQDLRVKFDETNVQFVKVKATNIGPIPDWHVGRGGKAHIFIGEIGIR